MALAVVGPLQILFAWKTRESDAFGTGTVRQTLRVTGWATTATNWRDVVATAAGSHHIDVSCWRDVATSRPVPPTPSGLRADGTVLAAGDNSHGQCAVAGWRR